MPKKEGSQCTINPIEVRKKRSDKNADIVNFLRRRETLPAVENDELLKAIEQKLIDAAERELTYSQFEEEASEILSTFGIDPLSPHRLQTVFRTNLFSAYSMAQLSQISERPGRFPLWRYVAILDDATRPFHRALNGKVFRLGEGPYPPIDYNCRCSAQHLHESEVESRRIEPSINPDIPSGVKRFDVQSDYERWAKKRVSGMNHAVWEHVERLRAGNGG